MPERTAPSSATATATSPAHAALPGRLGARTKLAGFSLAVVALTTGIAGSPLAEEGPAPEQFRTQTVVGSYLAGRIAQGQRDARSATTFLGTVLEQDPDSDIVLNQAFLNALQIGSYAEADGLAEKLVKLQPNNRIANLALGVKSFSERRWSEADKRFREASASPIGEMTSTMSRAWVAAAAGDAKAAQKLLDSLENVEWVQLQRLYNRALIADQSGDKTTANSAFDRLTTQEPQATASVISYAQFLAQTGNRTKAIEVLRANLKAVRVPHPLALAALKDLREGRTIDPIVSSANQGLSQVFYGLGEALASQGGIDLGAIYVRMALRLDPASPLALAALGSIQQQSKQYDQAIETYALLPASSPLSTSFTINRAVFLSALDRPDEAITVLKGLLERKLDDVSIDEAPGDNASLAAAKQLPLLQPAAKGKDVIALQAALDAAGYSAGVADGMYGKATEDAVRKLQADAKLTATGKFDAEAQAALIAKLTSAAQATASAKPSPKRNTRVDILTTIGDIERGRKNWLVAKDWYNKALDLLGKPTAEFWDLYYFRGICNERAKLWPEAEADFQQALQFKPDEPSVLNYLGYSWVDQGIRVDEALELINKAVQLKPDDPAFIDSLGWAYYRLGRYEEAVAQLERAVELLANDPVLNDHLGDAYWRAGRRLEAKFQWSWALSMKAEPEEVPKIKAKLESGLKDDPAKAAVAADPAKPATGNDTTKTP